jgi:hypothetical protein
MPGALTLDSHHRLAMWLFAFSLARAGAGELGIRGRGTEEYLGAGWLDCILAFLNREKKVAAALFKSSPPRDGEVGATFQRLHRHS